MSELVNRYVHQVGRYLPPKERAEIEKELRSQIQDRLEDRYGQSPEEAEVIALLTEMGHPYTIAASYSSGEYLVGPVLYPYMTMVLRYGWIIVPAIAIFMTVFGALIAAEPRPLFDVLIETVIAICQSTLMFFAVVVLFFGIMQHTYMKMDTKEIFKPLELPEVDDPRIVDRLEAGFGVVLGTIVALVFMYWLYVGGLTMSFNPSNPGEVIPVPMGWTLLFIIIGFAMTILHVIVLRRNRWNGALWTVQTLLEVIGAVCLYFVLLKPLFDHLVTKNSSFAGLEEIPAVLAIITAVVQLISGGSRLVRLWSYQD